MTGDDLDSTRITEREHETAARWTASTKSLLHLAMYMYLVPLPCSNTTRGLTTGV